MRRHARWLGFAAGLALGCAAWCGAGRVESADGAARAREERGQVRLRALAREIELAYYRVGESEAPPDRARARWEALAKEWERRRAEEARLGAPADAVRRTRALQEACARVLFGGGGGKELDAALREERERK